MFYSRQFSALVLMLFDNPNQLIEAILLCIERRAGGRFETTRERRDAIVRFSYRWAWLRAPERPDINRMLDVLESVMELLLSALDKLDQQSTTHGSLFSDLADQVNRLGAEMQRLATGTTDELSDGEVTSLLVTLQGIFDWTHPERLRSYIYASTGELLNDGLLGKERSELLAQVRLCAEELQK